MSQHPLMDVVLYAYENQGCKDEYKLADFLISAGERPEPKGYTKKLQTAYQVVAKHLLSIKPSDGTLVEEGWKAERRAWHPLIYAVLSAYNEYSVLDRINLWSYFRRAGELPKYREISKVDRAHRIIAEHLLETMHKKGLLYTDCEGWYRLAEP